MCYSSQIQAEHKKYCRVFGAKISVEEYYRIYWHREEGQAVQRLRAMDLAFLDDPQSDQERRMAELVREADARRLQELKGLLEAQEARLAAANAALIEKRARGVTKTKTLELEQRRAANKVADTAFKIGDLGRTEVQPRDWKIFPGIYASVLTAQNGVRVVMPMRFQCRPAGSPAAFDNQFPGTYNARRDSLGNKFWRRVWGHTHGLIQAEAFYESVFLHDFEQRELAPGEQAKKVEVEFRPDTGEEMLLACVWSRWEGDQGGTLDSFALVTEDPPPEVLAAGHDRCICPIDPADIDVWLNPDPKDLPAQEAVLDRRRRPFFIARRVSR